jgi:hypothetical protein
MNITQKISPRHFVQIWMKYDGDIYKIYKYCNENYSIASLRYYYTKIKKICPNLPTIKEKSEFETFPIERSTEIEKCISNLGKVNNTQKSVVQERFLFEKKNR